MTGRKNIRLVVDVECNRYENPDRITVIVAKDLDSGELYVYRDPSRASELLASSSMVVGHNFLCYDLPVLERIAGIRIEPERVCDTLVVSRLVDYLRPGGHSLAQWGIELGIEKQHADVTEEFFHEWSQELEDRCVSDVLINEAVFRELSPYIYSPVWRESLRVEHEVAIVCQELNTSGFGFNRSKGLELLSRLELSLLSLDKEIKESFPPRTKFIKEYTPRETKNGTISRSSIPRSLGPDLTPYSVGCPFSVFEWQEFNPGSPQQVVERLNEAGWRPIDKTKGHKEFLRAYPRNPTPEDEERFRKFQTYGWSLSEENLSTLPKDAPRAFHSLAHRRMISSRVSDLQEYLALLRPSNAPQKPAEAFSGEVGYPSSQEPTNPSPRASNGFLSTEREHPTEWRIHGQYNGIGAWSQRLSHAKPNTANIPTRKPQDSPEIASLNDEMRTLFVAARGRLLVGVDADQIQLRVLAHYLQDERFTDALVQGDKEKGTDVHSLNVKAIGPSCKGRRDAKTFIYAWLLDAGASRIAEILGCDRSAAKDADSRFVSYYPGLKELRRTFIADAARKGFFQGLDGRYVRVYGEDEKERLHYVLAGMLQNGEKLVMAYAIRFWKQELYRRGLLKDVKLVNWVHDEFQLEVPEDMELAIMVSSVVADSIRLGGEYLKTLCPMKGSVNGGHDRIAIGKNWLDTH